MVNAATKLPSVPSLSPSVTSSFSPMMGSLSLEVMGLSRATLTVPFGARNGFRLSWYFSRVARGLMFLGVPAKRGLGRGILTTSRSPEAAGSGSSGVSSSVPAEVPSDVPAAVSLPASGPSGAGAGPD